ncbi:hypothetical protein NECAME_12237 [Necator americanus]|uniref:Uncharacterized protein n=1 Tax=Necator americanus TaxID=51031 RepID=W2T241_NECAM|nr:hypothetical protein NECAME_12237 [Necator americanus]ETN75644.1 hypothetical protein NECAME_12237 [Necator americanus]
MEYTVERRAFGDNFHEGGMWAVFKSLACRILLVYFATSIIKSLSGGPSQVTDKSAPKRAVFQPSKNLFASGQPFDLHMYLDDSVC